LAKPMIFGLDGVKEFIDVKEEMPGESRGAALRLAASMEP
jgi:hypothetical protein